MGIGSRRPLCERWRRSSSGLLMAQGKILLGRWTADIYLEDCLKIRSTGVDNEDCAKCGAWQELEQPAVRSL